MCTNQLHTTPFAIKDKVEEVPWSQLTEGELVPVESSELSSSSTQTRLWHLYLWRLFLSLDKPMQLFAHKCISCQYQKRCTVCWGWKNPRGYKQIAEEKECQHLLMINIIHAYRPFSVHGTFLECQKLSRSTILAEGILDRLCHHGL